MFAVTGYTGFRRRNEDAELLKPDPGVDEAARHKKFTLAASAVLAKPDSLTSTFATQTGSASSTVRPSDYVVPDKKGPTSKPIPEAKFIGQSLYSSQYPDFFKDVR